MTRALVALEILCNESIPPDCKETGILSITEVCICACYSEFYDQTGS